MQRLKEFIKDLGTGKNIKRIELKLKTLRRRRRPIFQPKQ